MDENDRRSIYTFCTEEELPSGHVLFDHGELGEMLYFIEKGRLAVHKFTGFQEKMQVIALLDSGSVVGESALLAEHCHKTKVTAIEDSKVLALSLEKYKVLQREQPELAFRFLTYLLTIITLRLEKTSARLAHIL